VTGVAVLLGAIAVAVVAGLVLRARNGKVTSAKAASLPPEVLAELDAASAVTLVMFSTEFCAQCKHTRVVLNDLVRDTDGVAHAEIGLTDKPRLAKELSVLRTPTTIAVSADGVELLRVGGLPKREELLEALRPHLR
jgi:thiol-disulfide isomerase/thioredoxin